MFNMCVKQSLIFARSRGAAMNTLGGRGGFINSFP